MIGLLDVLTNFVKNDLNCQLYVAKSSIFYRKYVIFYSNGVQLFGGTYDSQESCVGWVPYF